MAATIGLTQQGIIAAERAWEPPAPLSIRGFGGLVVLEYLMSLFGESPKELFSRVEVLAVLDTVKKDKALLPEVAVTKPGRINAGGRTRPRMSRHN